MWNTSVQRGTPKQCLTIKNVKLRFIGTHRHTKNEMFRPAPKKESFTGATHGSLVPLRTKVRSGTSDHVHTNKQQMSRQSDSDYSDYSSDASLSEIIRDKSPSPKKSKHKHRSHKVRRRERKEERKNAKRITNKDTPRGFNRSKCQCGHLCVQPQCYTNIEDPRVVWDKSRYSKPYYPRQVWLGPPNLSN